MFIVAALVIMAKKWNQLKFPYLVMGKSDGTRPQNGMLMWMNLEYMMPSEEGQT